MGNSYAPMQTFMAWCLMPNHFHLMILVREVELFYEKKSKEVLSEIELFNKAIYLKKEHLNESIGILLRSYTRSH